MGQAKSEHSAPTAAAVGGVGAMVACCTVHILVFAGIVGGIGAGAIGGLAVGAGVVTAAATWLVLVLVRRRLNGRTRTAEASCGSR
ncbi:hypothetical protein Rhe02_15400 [Rhizocola hellebori]|uniref:Uncharacterized protein n=1 Tax=Rhizocola hellebori TaxID=1392758 RepID=A0A8J3Q543_9ACTN|nr:hypothetical protein [Rhizocola hellebori]GIH03473.1 hypothetical protein Rhe02_15400 [Rhizocola hellebori]